MKMLPQHNLLANQTSPYLRQHADNPVHWRPWSRAALDEAKSLQRPILLSVGYAACHWCHVMADESFEDATVATVMNRLFVNIKVDREERPDIDQIYMTALQAMGQQGGWPLTMFLTPDGRPFWGGTYFPPAPRYGQPGFIAVLEAVAKTWAERRGELDRSATALHDHVTGQLAPVSQAGSDAVALEAYAQAVYSLMDPDEGGLRGAPKFPSAPLMNILRLSHIENGVESHGDAVVFSLRQMLSGGIYDHLGGGLCRYATDSSWLAPHFEKMLYDNAQLIDLAGWAYALTGDELFRFRIEETVDWLRREMIVSGGGFASSLDADSDGGEGIFYLWTQDQMAEVLGVGDSRRFLDHYQLTQPSHWEGDPILNRLKTPHLDANDTDPAIRAMKERLLAARNRRNRPARDDKVLVDWNGLAISSLARAGRQFERRDWVELAAAAFRFVAESADGDRLPHSISGDKYLFPCLASDYAAMITASVDLYEATGDQSYLIRARQWLAALDRWHGDVDGLGHFLTSSDSLDVPIRVRGDIDEAIPSSTAQIIEAMTRLAMATSDHRLHERAIRAAGQAMGRIADKRHGQAGIIHAAAIANKPRKLILVAEPDSNLVSVANRLPDPSRTDVILNRNSGSGSVELPDGSVIGTTKQGAWLCLGQVCLPPIHDAATLETRLRRPN